MTTRSAFLFYTARAPYFQKQRLKSHAPPRMCSRGRAFEATVLRIIGRLHNQQGTNAGGLRVG